MTAPEASFTGRQSRSMGRRLMKKILLLIVLLCTVFCELTKLNDIERIEDASELIVLKTEYDTINPLINDQIYLHITLNKNKITHEQEILLQTDYGSLSEIPKINNSVTRNELTIISAGLKADVALHVDAELNHDITVAASITSENNNKYIVHKKLYLSSFKPDKITLKLDMDSLRTDGSGLITGTLQSLFGRVSNNCAITFTTISKDSAEAVVTPGTVLSYNEQITAIVKSSNQKPGDTYVFCRYGEIKSDTITISFYE